MLNKLYILKKLLFQTIQSKLFKKMFNTSPLYQKEKQNTSEKNSNLRDIVILIILIISYPFCFNFNFYFPVKYIFIIWIMNSPRDNQDTTPLFLSVLIFCFYISIWDIIGLPLIIGYVACCIPQRTSNLNHC